MSQLTYPGGDLDWDLVDRLNKSLRVSRRSVTEVAAALGVHRNTVTNYLSGRVTPDRRTLIAWAFTVGLPLDWLAEGKLPTGDDPGPVGKDARIIPRLDGATTDIHEYLDLPGGEFPDLVAFSDTPRTNRRITPNPPTNLSQASLSKAA